MVRQSAVCEIRQHQPKWSTPLLTTRSIEQFQSSWKRRMSPIPMSTPSTCGSQGMATKLHAWNASAPSGQPRIYLVEHLHYLGTSAQRMQGGRHMICQVTTALSAHAPLCARHQRNFKAICGTSMRPLCLLSARIRAQHTSARHKLHTKHI